MLKWPGLILITTLLVSCAPPVVKPIDRQDFRQSGAPRPHLVVLLAGRGAPRDYFEINRWVEIARQYTTEHDFVAPYAHFGYYRSRQLIARLREDIIQPARRQGYKTISLVGISMGGLGALLYSEEYPEDVDHIYLFAPFLGKTAVHEQIRADGGLPYWTLRAQDADDWNYTLWRWLKTLTLKQDRKKVFLGYGDNDRLRGHNLLAENLPAQHVIKIPGRHDDITFRQLWQQMLSQGLLKKRDISL